LHVAALDFNRKAAPLFQTGELRYDPAIVRAVARRSSNDD
jgi:hypothetical protein